MLNKYTLLLGAAALALATTNASAASYSTATMTASVNVEQATELTTTNVSFGKIVIRPSATSGNITATLPLDSDTVTITETDKAYALESPAAARGTICLAGNNTFTTASTANLSAITMPNTDANITTTVQYTPSVADGADHANCIKVGGVLTIPHDATGTYSKAFTIDLVYESAGL